MYRLSRHKKPRLFSRPKMQTMSKIRTESVILALRFLRMLLLQMIHIISHPMIWVLLHPKQHIHLIISYLKGSGIYLELLKLLEAGETVVSGSFPSFVCNRVSRLNNINV